MFELLTPIEATLRTLTPRTEKHGEDDVSAVSLGLTIRGPNTLLDYLSKGLRETLYKPVEDQEQLPGVEPSTPLLRVRGIESVRLDACFEGWTLKIDRGIDQSNPIALGGAKVDAFAVEPSEGGTIDLLFRVGSSDIDEDEAGWLFGHLKQSIWITLHAPEEKPEAIDGSVEAFRHDHPDATDLFAAGPDDSDGEDSEGGGADVGREEEAHG